MYTWLCINSNINWNKCFKTGFRHIWIPSNKISHHRLHGNESLSSLSCFQLSQLPEAIHAFNQSDLTTTSVSQSSRCCQLSFQRQTSNPHHIQNTGPGPSTERSCSTSHPSRSSASALHHHHQCLDSIRRIFLYSTVHVITNPLKNEFPQEGLIKFFFFFFRYDVTMGSNCQRLLYFFSIVHNVK